MRFKFPKGVAVDSSGYVYVADDGNCRVQKFDSNGNFISEWRHKGSKEGEFKFPKGVAVASGYVYVTDDENHRVQKFDSNGNFISEWRHKD